MTQHLVRPRTAPGLVVKIQGTEQRLRPGSSYRVGRDPQSDIVLTDSRVSWNHAILRAEHDAWLIEDCDSTNGTFVASRQVTLFEITKDCVLRLGDAADGPALFCSVSRPVTPGPSPSQSPAGSSFEWPRVDLWPTSVIRAPARTLRIGRAEDNVVLADLSVSRHHAELRNAATFPWSHRT